MNYCSWHQNLLGKYQILENNIALDYSYLAKDSLSAYGTIYHEGTHYLLSTTTEYGLATRMINGLLIDKPTIDKSIIETICKQISNSQLFVHEGTASLVEVLMIQHKLNKPQALRYASTKFPTEYLERFNRLKYVLDFSIKYRNAFINRIPQIALQTDVRRVIVEKDYLNNNESFLEYLTNPATSPDLRYEKLIEKVKLNGAICKKSDEEICAITEIPYYPPPTNKEVANFLNYLFSFTPNETNRHFTEKDITPPKTYGEVFTESFERVFIANINLNIESGSIVEWKLEDFLHFKDIYKAIVVNRIDDLDENKSTYSLIIGKEADAGIIGFTKNGEKYITCVDTGTLLKVIQKELNNCTLIVKWGLYKPLQGSLEYFGGDRKPNVVIYNYIEDLKNDFQRYFEAGRRVKTINIRASEDHIFQTLIVIDDENVIYMVNILGQTKTNSFLEQYSSNITQLEKTDTIEEDIQEHLNNAIAIWLGIAWEVNTYKSLTENRLVLRS